MTPRQRRELLRIVFAGMALACVVYLALVLALANGGPGL